jgi:predicted RNA-binding protein YlxR (DUF448 family)
LCVGCGARAPQLDLVRMSAAADGRLLVDARRHAGRSGYLHRDAACWQRFAARQGPVRSLGRTLNKATRAALVRELERLEQSAMMGER